MGIFTFFSSSKLNSEELKSQHMAFIENPFYVSVIEKFLKDNPDRVAKYRPFLKQELLEKGKLYTQCFTGSRKRYENTLVTNGWVQCFENAAKFTFYHPEFHCVIGSARDKTGAFIHHAFNVNDEGQVIDPTALNSGQKFTSYFGISFHRKDLLENGQRYVENYGISALDIAKHLGPGFSIDQKI